MDEIEITHREGILQLTLARPDKLNAISPRMLEGLRRGLDQADEEDVRVLLLAGKGRSFCTGGDMEHLGLEDASAGHSYIAEVTNILAMLRQQQKPIVAAVQGWAVGAGAEIACEADLLVLATDAVFRLPDVSIGSTPATLFRLVRLVGLPRAARMAFLGEDLDATDAANLGLPWDVVPPERLLDSATDLAKRLTRMSPMSLRFAKQALWLAQGTDGVEDLRVNLEAEIACYGSTAMRSAIGDFVARKSKNSRSSRGREK